MHGKVEMISTCRWELLEKALLVAVLLDLGLGGNGYLIQLFGVRLRVIFFGLCMVWVVLRLLVIEPVRIEQKWWWLLAAFVVITAFGTALGYVHGNRPGAITAELKPLAYFFMLPFFLIAIRTGTDVKLVAAILVLCGTTLAILYVLVLLAAAVGIVDYLDVFNFLRRSDEFIFRMSDNKTEFVGFLYKGAFYTCVAAIFLAFSPSKRAKALCAIAVIATAMTLTRGLCLALLLALVVGAVMDWQRKRGAIVAAQCVLLIAVTVLAWRVDRQHAALESLARPDRKTSPSQEMRRPGDQDRVADILFVVHDMDIQTFVIGRGIGAPIRGRERIEMNPLEVLYKQGIVGAALWLALLWLLLALYRAAMPNPLVLPMFLSGLFVYFATVTNTFLTGSIGMAVVFIAISSLVALKKPLPFTSGSQRGQNESITRLNAGCCRFFTLIQSFDRPAP